MAITDFILNPLIDRIADRLGMHVQGGYNGQRHRDYAAKGETYSVEAEISEALADLMLMYSGVDVTGSARAEWLDAQARRFFLTQAKAVAAACFVHGDVLVVPSWNGRNVQNVVVPSNAFEVLACSGDEITAAAYLVDEKRAGGTVHRLFQAVELVGYDSPGGRASGCRYRMFAAANDSLSGGDMRMWPEWADEPEWTVPNVDRLLVGRMKSPVIDPTRPNTVKGLPICYGAGEPIRQIHRLLDAMSTEFDLSEKAIMADKRLFQTTWRGDEQRVELPRGRERLYMVTKGLGGDPQIHEWAPEIRHQAYLDAIDKQEQLVERAVGVSSGIISRPNDMNYQNVDNVRKSQQKTIAFVETARRAMEAMLEGLVYSWDVLANYHGIAPLGAYEATYRWSDDYVETFADMRDAIIAGEAIGATDAADYRMWLYGETAEQARERVAEIQAGRPEPSVLMPV